MVIIGRKLCIMASFYLGNNQQGWMGGVATLITSMVLHVYARPYEDHHTDWCEFFQLVATVLVLVSGAVFTILGDHDTADTGARAFRASGDAVWPCVQPGWGAHGARTARAPSAQAGRPAGRMRPRQAHGAAAAAGEQAAIVRRYPSRLRPALAFSAGADLKLEEEGSEPNIYLQSGSGRVTVRAQTALHRRNSEKIVALVLFCPELIT